mmetsp:Transcript_5040/g.7284  ORF Transcript_5040/g.7284 Transcript_5040/m.7284 type:complete len:393 (-) Transcript_5040:182-1360(-)
MKIFLTILALAGTAFLSSANHYETSIGTDKACYSRGEPIYVHFVNQDCRIDDWVGIYPAGTNFEALPDETLKMWVWTCGRQRKQCNVEYASIKFASDRQEAYNDIWPLEQGQYIAVLSRNSDSPYFGTAVSSTFAVKNSCELGDDDDDEGDNTDSPSSVTTQSPTYNPTTLAPTTRKPITPVPKTPKPTMITSAPVQPPTDYPVAITPLPTIPRPITLEPTMVTSPPTPFPSPGPTLSPVIMETLPPSPLPTTTPVTAGCPEIPPGGCSVCGEGKCIGKPDEIFAFPGQPVVSCGELQVAGLDKLIPLKECSLLPTLIDACECREGSSGGNCSVCGDGKSVGNPLATFSFPGQPEVSCGTLELAGSSGLIPVEACDVFPDLIYMQPCGCKED